jgi:hypothetical protein
LLAEAMRRPVPLLTQLTGRRNHEHASLGLVVAQTSDDRQSLEGLAHAHFVGEQHTRLPLQDIESRRDGLLLQLDDLTADVLLSGARPEVDNAAQPSAGLHRRPS